MQASYQSQAKTILITGSSGRIGGAIAASLSKHYSIIGIDIKSGSYTTNIMDIRSSEIVKLVEKVNFVIHTAALLPQHIGIHGDKEFWDINVSGTENLLHACLKNKVDRFIFASTTSIYDFI